MVERIALARCSQKNAPSDDNAVRRISASHPSIYVFKGQTRHMKLALDKAGTSPEDIDIISTRGQTLLKEMLWSLSNQRSIW